jgi:predicted AAA+ superfamily ATPase
MLEIPRILEKRVLQALVPQRAALVFGARRTGKTVLMRHIQNAWPGKALWLNGEDADTLALLQERSAANYRRLLDGVDLLLLDEAQSVPEIGQKLKLILDEVPGVSVLASGSASFDLMNQTGEPLVGRSQDFRLLPFSAQELSAVETELEARRNLEERLVYGSYPDAVKLQGLAAKADYLRGIVDSYLLRDILAIDGIRNASKMRDLLRLVAFQVGSEVSLDELGRQLGMSKTTVERYLDLLSKVFVLFRLGAYSRNQRKEVRKSSKWYFCDTGVRNAVLGNFRPLAVRDDTGKLWENYATLERVKNAWNSGDAKNFYFWRTYDRQEIDLIEESAGTGEIVAFEMKWSEQPLKIPAAFASAYPTAAVKMLHRGNLRNS